LLYHDALGRLPLRAEIDATMRALINGATRRSVASAVLRSPEASERAATRMYDALLGRPRAVGEPTSIADIIGGQEYADLVQPDSSGSDAGKVVRTAACDLLGRAATDAELQLALAAPTREQAAAAFLGSSAYGEGLVKQLYHRYLRRMANRAEARQLAGPPEQVAAAIAGSSEYFQRANGGGALVRVSALPDGRIRLELSRRAELRLGVIRRGKRIATRRLGRRPQGWSSADWHGPGHVAVIVEAWSHGRMIDASDPVLVTR
jgi:hypothetical protein